MTLTKLRQDPSWDPAVCVSWIILFLAAVSRCTAAALHQPKASGFPAGRETGICRSTAHRQGVYQIIVRNDAICLSRLCQRVHNCTGFRILDCIAEQQVLLVMCLP